MVRIKCFGVIILAFFQGIFCNAQKIDNTASYREMNGERYFRFNYDNDFFTATDHNYTQGYSFEFVSPFWKKNPINKLFFKPKKGKNRYGLAWEHIGFTPKDYASEEIQFGDRPFASALMIKSFMINTNFDKKSRFISTISTGVLGPTASGDWMQTEVHRATGNIIPQGWHNQIADQLILNYELRHEKQLLRFKDYLTIQSNANARLGTLFTDGSVGASFMLGKINRAFSEKNNSKFQLYLYGQTLGYIIGHNATLQGSIFPNKKSVYTIPTSDIERLRAEINYGIVLKVGEMYFEYSQAFQTKEFNQGNSYRWGGLKAGFNF